MRGRHPQAALTLVAMGALLLVSILIGQRIGDHVLFGSTERRLLLAQPLPTVVPESGRRLDPAVSSNWKRLQVVSIPTDPAFPDPRVTTPPPRPRPAPTVKPTRLPFEPAATAAPVPAPLATRGPDDAPQQ